MNYQLTDSGMVTSDPAIASMFLGKDVYLEHEIEGVYHTDEWGIDDDGFMFDLYEDGYTLQSYEITIPYPLIADALKPVEGEAFFFFYEDGHEPEYCRRFNQVVDPGAATDIACNLITINLTVGELRELIERVKA